MCVAMLVGAVFVSGGTAHAHFCNDPDAVIDSATDVFKGTVTDIVGSTGPSSGGRSPGVAVIDVVEVWRGHVPRTVVLPLPLDDGWLPDADVGDSVFIAGNGGSTFTKCVTFSRGMIETALVTGSPPNADLPPDTVPAYLVDATSTDPEPVDSEDTSPTSASPPSTAAPDEAGDLVDQTDSTSSTPTLALGVAAVALLATLVVFLARRSRS